MAGDDDGRGDDGIDRDVHQDVADVLVRYATAIDRRDWDLFATCFTDDCHADYGPIGVWHGVEPITAWMRDTHDPLGHTMHRITNVVVRAGVDENHVAARSYVDALVLFPGNEAGTQAVGWYDDELVRGADGWRIASRRFTSVMVRLVPDGSVLDLGGLM